MRHEREEGVCYAIRMGYQPLRIDPRTPKTVREFIRDHLEMQFHDVHCLHEA